MKKYLFMLATVAAMFTTVNCPEAKAQNPQQQRSMRNPMDNFPGEKVYEDENVVFHKIEDHVWVGHGNVMAMETLYVIEGEEKSVLIDCGTKIDHLNDIVAKLTQKPLIVLATHVHPDHVGAVDYFPEVWINPADTVNVPEFMPNYQGKINYLTNGQTFDLGGRTLETFFTPGHTPGSTTFIDKAHHYGFSGDSFGNGNLLLTTSFSVLKQTCLAAAEKIQQDGIEFFYNGHFSGRNAETLQRVNDLVKICDEVQSGELQGENNPNGMIGLNKVITKYGVRVNYADSALK